jgi:hypothetical protein
VLCTAFVTAQLHAGIRVCSPDSSATTYADDGIDPFDQIWDISGGGSSKTPGASRQLVITTREPTPMKLVAAIIKHFDIDDHPVFPSRLGGVVEGEAGTLYEQTFRLDSTHSTAILDLPVSDSTGMQRARVRAIGSPDLWLKVTEADIDADGNTLSLRELPGVVVGGQMVYKHTISTVVPSGL